MIYEYCSLENKIAFPYMSTYDLLLKFMGILASSKSAIIKILKGVFERLDIMYNLELDNIRLLDISNELNFLNNILA